MQDEIQRNEILNHVEPNRRDFVKRVLAGAAFAVPVVATFSIESLFVDSAYAQSGCGSSSSIGYGCCLPDLGYVGPSVFQAYVADVGGGTRVNGEVILTVDNDRDHGQTSTTLRVRVRLTQDAPVSTAYLTINGSMVAVMELHSSNGFDHHDQSGSVGAADLRAICDFDSLLQAMAGQQVMVVLQGTYRSSGFDAQGMAAAANASPIIQTSR